MFLGIKNIKSNKHFVIRTQVSNFYEILSKEHYFQNKIKITYETITYQ